MESSIPIELVVFFVHSGYARKAIVLSNRQRNDI